MDNTCRTCDAARHNVMTFSRSSAKRLITLFPKVSNAIWRKIYLARIHKDDYGATSHAEQFVTDRDGRRQVFAGIFEQNSWTNKESLSGYGSTLYATTIVRNELPKLLKAYDVTTFLDAPCGDFNWMSHVKFPNKVHYVGCDIVVDLIDSLKKRFATPNRSFDTLDIVDGPIPKFDFWLCRDALFHLTLADGLQVIYNAALSGAGYFASTTFDFVTFNGDIPTGKFRYINLQQPPYSLPAPIAEIDDFLPPYPPRQIGIWSNEQLRRRFGLS